MENLSKYILESIVNEGGAAGHMKHVIDYDELTRSDLETLINELFSGKVEDITEKIDGTNIQATMNTAGEVVFIRNQKDLNSEQGGMTISDMAAKWADKPSVAETFTSAGEVITKVFNKIGKKFFNPDPNTRRVANCECVIAGTTNIIPYASAQVDFHGIWIYEKDMDGKWKNTKTTEKGLETLQMACQGIEKAQITPKVVIAVTKESNALAEKYIKQLYKVFKEDITIDEWKFKRFQEYLNDNKLKWISENPEYEKVLYNRWFKADHSVNIRLIKQQYPEHEDELVTIDKKIFKDITATCIDPIDTLFLKMGNDIINLCQGLINAGQKSQVVKQLSKALEQTVKDVNATGSEEIKNKLLKQLTRLNNLGGTINPAEGIVFKYRGKIMKLTGSFSPLNQILGSIKFSK